MAREYWKTGLGFLFSAIGSAIGIGNIWRFNYILYENGGGIFFLPYLFAVLVMGVPLLISEVWSGFWARGSSPIIYKKIYKWLEPLGWWTLINISIINIYYNALVGWFMSYAIFSFRLHGVADTESFFYNFLTTPYPIVAGVLIWIFNMIILSLGVRKGLERFSLIFVSMMWILIFILLIRATTLPGAGDGIKKYLFPNWSKLYDWNVWMVAFGQVAFSLSIAMGIMPVFGSYLKKKREIIPNSFATAFADASFSAISAITIFSVLGVVGLHPAEGFGLAFMTFPLAAAQLPAKEIFSFIFFLALTIAGFTSALTSFEAVIAGITDRFKMTRKFAVVCLGIPSTLATAYIAGNLNAIKFWDGIASTISLPIIALAECLIFGWLIGANRIRNSLNKISRIKLNPLFDLGLKFLSPIVLLVLVGLGSKFVTRLELKIILLVVATSIFIVISKKTLKWRRKLKLPFIE
ncbi:MAG: sodium-dependent transporter [Candidatus Aenigmatarchaeota archaeon]